MKTVALFLLSAAAALAAPAILSSRQQGGFGGGEGPGEGPGNGQNYGNGQGPGGGFSYTPTAAYFMLNNPAGNKLVAMNVSTSSSLPLSGPVVYSTGGNGSFATSGGAITQVDTLFSAGSVQTSGEFVLNVNAGSNSISLFSINPHNPLDLTLVDTINSGGDFPNSVAYAFELGIACVTNTGTTNGIACFNVTQSGLKPHTPLFHTGMLDQTTPPNGPSNTYSRIAWNVFTNALTVTVKGNPATNTTGSIIQFLYNARTGTFSAPVYTTPLDELDLAFSFTFINETSAVVVGPGYGFGIVEDLNDYNAVTSTGIRLPTSQLTCWTSTIPGSKVVYASDGGENTIFFNDLGTNVVGGFNNGNPPGIFGTFDSVAADGLFFALTGGTGFTVINLNNNNTLVQWFNTSATVSPTRQFYEGFALYPGLPF